MHQLSNHLWMQFCQLSLHNNLYEASDQDFKIILANDAIALTNDTGFQELKNWGMGDEFR
jgi:hypothetical protein